MTISSNHPTLPPLYFAQKGALISANKKNTSSPSSDNNNNNDDNDQEETVQLPAELLQTILSSYATWGDLAKLATVQSGWKNLLQDAAAMSTDAKWDLAQALLHGTHGLQVNPTAALQHLYELARVPVNEKGLPGKPKHNVPPKDDKDNNNSNNINTNSNNSKDDEYFAPAMVEIANCYLEGRGVDQANGPAGLAWMAAAFEFGRDASAAHRLGVIYERDYQMYTNIQVDVYEAALWFEAAAQAGNADAMAELGLCYELGCGKEQSDEKALDWYMRAAEKGNLTAQYSVGEAFEEARGVPQSDEEACLWYYKAAVDGCVDSKLALQRLHDIARIILPGVGQMFDA